MEFEYDIALSFAGENREYFEKVAQILKDKGFRIFYDKFEEDNLWGRDLGIHFDYVYNGIRSTLGYLEIGKLSAKEAANKILITFLEQSCKNAALAFVFQPNDNNTWLAVKAIVSNFLTQIWKAGGLQGASAGESFSVDCGLGTTMIADDIDQRFMVVVVKVAIVHPAEFSIITFQQQQATFS